MREKRKPKYFTSEQISKLKSNPYTHSVSGCCIRFTLEFKELFWMRYCNGVSAKQIFTSLGYDIDILGDGRIFNFASQLSKDKEIGRDLDVQPVLIKHVTIKTTASKHGSIFLLITFYFLPPLILYQN